MRRVLLCLGIIGFLIVNLMVPMEVHAAGVGPQFKESFPKANSKNVKVDETIKIVFQKPIKFGKNYKSICIKPSGGKAEAAKININSNSITFKTKVNMKYNTNYTVLIPKGSLVDYSGKSLAKDISLSFKTKAKDAPTTQGTVNNSVDSTGDSKVKNSLMLHAFYSGKTEYNPQVESYLGSLDSVSFAWLNLEAQNDDFILNQNNMSTDFHVPKDYEQPLIFCKSKNIPAQLAIFSDGNTAKGIMSDPLKEEELVNRIVESLKVKLSNGDVFEYSGVVIDFEGFRQADTAVSFNDFLMKLKAALEPLNKKLHVAVNVRLYWPGYDYRTILKYADRVILMAHDYEPTGDITKGDVDKYTNYSSSNPIFTMAPINKVREALEDLIGSINSKEDMGKIILQISFGISQWQFDCKDTVDFSLLDYSTPGNRTSPTYDMLMNRLINKDNKGSNFSYGYINELESPYLSYYNSSSKTFNFILYEDSRSVKSEIALSKLEGIGGISLWRLGNIPDYNDESGKSYYMDVWTQILGSIK